MVKGGSTPIDRIASSAAFNCPFPPSISRISGNGSSSCCNRRSRRLTTSRIAAKSSTPSTLRIRNRL